MKHLTRISLDHPRAVLGLLAVATLALAGGIPRLHSEIGYRAFLGAGHPSVARFDAFLERFAGGLPLAVVFDCGDTPHCRSVFDPDALATMAAIERALAGAPGVEDTRSAASATVLVAARPPFPPRPRRFYADGQLAGDREALAAAARGDPNWIGELVSEDGTSAAVVLEVGSSDGDVHLALWNRLEEALRPHESRGYRFARVGGPVEFVVAGGELAAATRQLIPLMVALVALVLVALFRALGPALLVLATVGVAVVWTLGALGWLGFGENTLTLTLAPLVLVIGVCDGIHVVSRYLAAPEADRASAATRREALLRAAGEVGGPCLMTTVTTACGFLSFLVSDLTAFGRFGVVAALGVANALLLSFTLLPIAVQRTGPGGRGGERLEGAWDRGLVALATAGRRNAVPILLAAVLAGVAGGVGYQRLRVESSFEDLYGEQSRVVAWVDFVAERLRGPDTLEIALLPPPRSDPADPAVLQVVARAAEQLTGIEQIERTRSVIQPLGQLHRLLARSPHGALEPAPSLAANRALYAMLGRVPRDPTRRYLDRSGPVFRLSAEAEKPPQEVLRALLAEVDARLARTLPEGWQFEVTGPIAVVDDMISAIQATQLRSFAVAACVVALLVGFFLRSPVWALAAMLPTLLPVVVTLGAMGFLGVPLDVGSAMVAAVVVGIAVDDAIHLLSGYRDARRRGRAPPAAVDEAVRHVGRALVTTSLALSLGFLALSLSPWQSVASFGVVSGVAILAALFAVLGVLPATIHLLTRTSN